MDTSYAWHVRRKEEWYFTNMFHEKGPQQTGALQNHWPGYDHKAFFLHGGIHKASVSN